MKIEPIAFVRSCFGSKFAVPRQPGLCSSAWGEVVFEKGYDQIEALRGLEDFSHVWLIFGFHQTVERGWKPTVRPPRLGGNKRVGVFASRATHRPNGLGLSLVALEGVEVNGFNAPQLKVGGLDLLDGTPIYDIKPYLAYAESIPDARFGYAGHGVERLEVVVDDAAKETFDALSNRAQAVIREALSLDPRPAVQSGESGRVYGASICNHNVRFVIGEAMCRIVELAPL